MSLYHKMVLALPPEFYEIWEWQAGDRVLHKQECSEEWETEFIIDNGIAHIISVNKGNVFGKFIPLPSQRQLQSMLCLDPIHFIENLYEYAQEPLLSNLDIEQFKMDMECFTLAYVMDRKFKMYWDGEKWINNEKK